MYGKKMRKMKMKESYPVAMAVKAAKMGLGKKK